MSETTRLTNEYIEITKQDIEAHERTAKDRQKRQTNISVTRRRSTMADVSKHSMFQRFLPDGRSGYSPIWSVRCAVSFIKSWMPMKKITIIGNFSDSSRS